MQPNKSVSLNYAASLGPLLRDFDTDNHSGNQSDRGFSSTHFIIIRTRKKEPADSCIASYSSSPEVIHIISAHAPVTKAIISQSPEKHNTTLCSKGKETFPIIIFSPSHYKCFTKLDSISFFHIIPE